MRGQFVGILIMLSIGACAKEQAPPKTGSVVEKDSTVAAEFMTAELKEHVDRLYPLQKLPLVIDSAWHQARALLDDTDTVRPVMAPEVVTALGLRRAWIDTANDGSTPRFMAFDLPYTYFYPICRFRSPDGEKEFIVTEANGPGGRYNAYYLLAPFPPKPTDSINTYFIVLYHGNLEFSFEGYCRIDYPTIITSSLLTEYTPDGDSILSHTTGPTKTWRIDQ